MEKETTCIGFTRLMKLGSFKMVKTLMEKMYLETGSIDVAECNRNAKTRLASMSETEFKNFKKSL